MEFRYAIEPATPLVRVRCRGVVTPKKLIEMMKHSGAMPATDWSCRSWSTCAIPPGIGTIRIRRAFAISWYASASAGGPSAGPPSYGPGALAAVCHITVAITQALDCGIRIRLFEDPIAASDRVLAGKAPTQHPELSMS
jgi:hypothetical protein